MIEAYKKGGEPISILQLNEYGTAPYFLQLSQNMTSYWTIFGAKQVNSGKINLGKIGEKHKSKQTINCHVLD